MTDYIRKLLIISNYVIISIGGDILKNSVEKLFCWKKQKYKTTKLKKIIFIIKTNRNTHRSIVVVNANQADSLQKSITTKTYELKKELNEEFKY
jgi:hypothetical protein